MTKYRVVQTGVIRDGKSCAKNSIIEVSNSELEKNPRWKSRLKEVMDVSKPVDGSEKKRGK